MNACPRCHSKVGASATLCPSCGARLDDKAGARKTGITIGAWKLRERFHECAAGLTYKAEDVRRPGEGALVKVLRPELCADDRILARFFDDVRLIDRLGHANLIRVREYGERAPSEKYLVLEDVGEGVDLMTGIRLEGYLPVEVAVSVGIQLASALGALHDAGVVHQNLKPQSIIITEAEGRKDFVKLLDAGDATLSCPVTPGYISPEQAAQKAADARSDIYTLGVILYEMVTGRRPFEADTMSDYLFKHMTAEPPRPSELPALKQRIPPALEELILVCLEKNPAMRPLSMKEVERSLRIIASGSGDATAEVRYAQPQRKGRGRGALWALFLVGAAAAGALAWTNTRPGGATTPASAAASEPEPAPAPAPVPVAPEVTPAPTVEILFDSTPQGADVYRTGETTPLGRTPFRASFERAASPIDFDFHLDGHEIGTQPVSLDTPGRVSVELTVMAEEVSDAEARQRRERRKRVVAGAADRGPKDRDRSAAKGRGEPAPRSDPKPKETRYDKTGVIDPFE